MKPLSLNDSSVLKGIAILLMLCHHVFEPEKMDLYTDFKLSNMPVLGTFALQGGVCVAIFVFLSGYGLMAKYGFEEKIHIKSFYWQRFVKLMMNYWLVWLIFVPLSVFWLSDRSFGWWYSTSQTTLMGILDFLGIAKWFGSFPYNPTWWFYSCIIGLYLLFPLLRWLMTRGKLLTLVLAVALFFPPGPLGVVRQYIPVFVCGMLYAMYTAENHALNTPPEGGCGLRFARCCCW